MTCRRHLVFYFSENGVPWGVSSCRFVPEAQYLSLTWAWGPSFSPYSLFLQSGGVGTGRDGNRGSSSVRPPAPCRFRTSLRLLLVFFLSLKWGVPFPKPFYAPHCVIVIPVQSSTSVRISHILFSGATSCFLMMVLFITTWSLIYVVVTDGSGLAVSLRFTAPARPWRCFELCSTKYFIWTRINVLSFVQCFFRQYVNA